MRLRNRDDLGRKQFVDELCKSPTVMNSRDFNQPSALRAIFHLVFLRSLHARSHIQQSGEAVMAGRITSD